MSALPDAAWLIEALIASSLLMVVVLLLRRPAQRALGPQLAYWLWALPALRMAMPPLPASWRDSAVAPISAASQTVMVLVDPIVPAAAAADGGSLPWLALIAGAWGLGALAFFTWHGLAHFSYVRRIVAPPASHARLPDGITLVESDEAIGPVAFGVFRRFVAVPTDFAERYDADERKLALAHELGHHARGDLIANWIALAMLAVHWFNPLAWIAYRKFRADQEMANDARVLGALPPIERHAYACAIVKAAHGRAVTAACHLHTIEDLKGRLRMLKASRKSRRVVMAGAIGVATVTVAGLGLTASGAAAEKIRTVAETGVVALAQTEAAAPPEAPAAPPSPAAARKTVVVVRDGKTTRYEGAAADAYLAAHPDRPAGREVRKHRIVIRDRDGTTRTYEDAEADAYLNAHPEMRPAIPPVPPVPPALAAPSVGVPAPPRPPRAMVPPFPGVDGQAITRRVMRSVPEVVTGDCGGSAEAGFIRNEVRGGKPRMVICQNRIDGYAASQAAFGRRSAVVSLDAGRAAIARARGLSEGERARAIAGIEAARAEVGRDLARDDED